MSMINEIFTEKMIFSLGWTFINSLWQGGSICIVNWIILLMLSKQNARLRYIVSTVSLFTILLFAVCSFFIISNYYDSNLLTISSLKENGIKNSLQDGVYNLFFLRFIPFNSSEYLDYFNTNLPLILTVWFWSVLFLSLKQLGGFALTQRLGRYKTTVPAADWQKKVDNLKNELGINKSVKLLESAIVKVPTVVGFLKPIILIPLGLLLAIPANQLETIFLHELAHIKRRDFLINILQNILEVIFFFNPFVWLISSSVRSEREHCCDDMVVNVSGDAISYIKALANISTMDSVKSNYAMALSLNQNQLLKRIDRIIKMKNYKSSYSRVFISTLVLLIGLTFLSANAMAGYSNNLENTVIAQQSQIVQEAKQNEKPKTQSSVQANKANDEKMKKKQLLLELKKKYEATTDEETKKKIEEKIKSIQKNNYVLPSAKDTKLQKKEQMIMELKKKYETTTDEELKKKIEEKIKSIKNNDVASPPQNPEELKMKKEQIIKELEKKYEATTDKDMKKKIEEKIKAIKEK